jgi:cytochrome d ubiquinol oxidase subunit II
MGAIVGGIASGRVPAGGQAGDPVESWINPTSVVGGVLAVAAVAYLSAVYLVWDARRLGETDMAEYFRRRAVVSAVIVAVIAGVGAFVLHADAAYVFDGLTSRALPVAILSGACGAGALLLLVRGAARGARALALVAVAAAVLAWGVAQWPYILPESLTFAAAAAPSGTLTAVLAVVVLAAVVVLPGFVLLYVLDQRGLLPEEGVDAVADRRADGVLDQRAR